MSVQGISIVIALAIGAVCLCAFHLMLKEIRENYPSEYDHMSQSAPFKGGVNFDDWRLMVFMFRRKYTAFGSKRVRLLGDLTLLCSVAGLLVVIFSSLF